MSFANPKLCSHTSPEKAISIMADGSLAAETVLRRVYDSGHDIDPKNSLGGARAPFYQLDSLDIYGERIATFFSAIAGGDMVQFLALLRAVQMGIYPASTLITAINAGTIDTASVKAITDEVKSLIPSFGRTVKKRDIESLIPLLLLSSLGPLLKEAIHKRAAKETNGAAPTENADDLADKINVALAQVLPEGMTSEVTVIKVDGLDLSGTPSPAETH